MYWNNIYHGVQSFLIVTYHLLLSICHLLRALLHSFAKTCVSNVLHSSLLLSNLHYFCFWLMLMETHVVWCLYQAAGCEWFVFSFHRAYSQFFNHQVPSLSEWKWERFKNTFAVNCWSFDCECNWGTPATNENENEFHCLRNQTLLLASAKNSQEIDYG